METFKLQNVSSWNKYALRWHFCVCLPTKSKQRLSTKRKKAISIIATVTSAWTEPPQRSIGECPPFREDVPVLGGKAAVARGCEKGPLLLRKVAEGERPCPRCVYVHWRVWVLKGCRTRWVPGKVKMKDEVLWKQKTAEGGRGVSTEPRGYVELCLWRAYTRVSTGPWIQKELPFPRVSGN